MEAEPIHADFPPFFIVGCSRSGTTLLQALIDAHPDLAMPPESHVYDRFGPVFHSYGNLSERRNRVRLIGDLLRDAFIRQWRLDATVLDVEKRLRSTGRAGVIDALFALYADMHGARYWGDKTPEHIRHLREIRTDFPDARLIHLVRDGRDVAEAMRRMIWGPVSAVGLAREWRREVMHWRGYCDGHGTGSTLVLRYEDLVTEPHETVHAVLEFLGVPYVDTVTDYASTPLVRELGATQGTWHSSLRRGISAAKIGVYRLELRPREIEIIEATASDALLAYGYRPEHAQPRPATLVERLNGYVADRAVRWSRKLFHPAVIWLDLQARLRRVRRAWRRRDRSASVPLAR